MKKLLFCIVVIASANSYAQEDFRSIRNRRMMDASNDRTQKSVNELVSKPISEYNKTQTWDVNTCSNDVRVMICTDSTWIERGCAPAFREFHFSKDGRLISISEIKEVRKFGKFNILTNAPSRSRSTQARDK